MNSPFKIIRGDQEAPISIPTGFAKFDNRRAIGDRIIARHIADRDRAIDRERNQTKKK